MYKRQFHELGDTFVANALNIVVLTAALSVYNSCVYCNSRMLFGLAHQGNAPKALASVDKRGVPVNTILAVAYTHRSPQSLTYVSSWGFRRLLPCCTQKSIGYVK